MRRQVSIRHYAGKFRVEPRFALWALLLALLVPASLLTARHSSAQSVPATPGAANNGGEQDVLFKRILKEPANLDVSFRHAELSTANGDYEAAIGSLERMLFYNPNLPRVMLELGVLYFRLGSYEMSREYFKKSIAASDTPPEVRVRVDAYLIEIEKRLNPNHTTGFFQTGARYQTNANAGPLGENVRVFGFDATLDRQFVKAHDWNWFAQGVVRNTIDFGNQRGDAWESTIGAYLTRHRDFTRLNTALIDIQTGPRFALFPEKTQGWSWRPYVGVTGINLGGSNYLAARTAGSAINWMPNPGWNIELGGERSWRDFYNSDDYPTVENQSGFINTGYVNLYGPLFGGWTWAARGAISDNKADAAWQSFLQRGVDFSLSYGMDVAMFGATRRFTVSPFVGYLDTQYEQADALVDPTMVRHDRERKVGIAFDALITEHAGIGIRLQYSKTDSNIPNYQTDNFSVLAGPTIRF
jgi:hypothetical protein